MTDSERQAKQQERIDQLQNPTPDTAESVQADREQSPAEAEGAFDPGPEQPGVAVEAQITDEGIVFAILVPWGAVQFTQGIVPEEGVGEVPPTDPNAS